MLSHLTLYHRLVSAHICAVLISWWILSPQTAAAAGNVKLPLPSNPNSSYRVEQGNNTGPSHTGLAAYAFDIGLPVGTTVYASRAGKVRKIYEDGTLSDCLNPAYNVHANFIIIDHGDGSEALYLHLKNLGVDVSVNDFVRQGQPIGQSGNTGNSCGPHLHFQVQDFGAAGTQGNYLTQSRPIIFADYQNPSFPNDNGVPVEGRYVKARNYGYYQTAMRTWYFAEGWTGNGFDEFLTIQNPNGVGTTATMTFYKSDGSVVNQYRWVPANSRETVIVHDATQGVGRNVAASVKVEAPDPIVVERPMYFAYGGSMGVVEGGHDALGATPHHDVGQFTWWFSEGYTGAGFDEFLTIQNPNGSEASITITYFLTGGGTVVKDGAVPPSSRSTVEVHNSSHPLGLGRNLAAAVKIQSNRRGASQEFDPVPIIVERPMYFNYGGWAEGGHTTLGALNPDYSWYFAEGTTNGGFEQFFTILNPGSLGPNNMSNSVANVTVTYYKADGTTISHGIDVPARSRETILPRSVLGWNQAFGTRVTSNVPIVVERPIYFSYGTSGWSDGHVVVGANKPEYLFYFAEGWTGNGFDEYLTILNPNNISQTVTITYYLAGGGTVPKSVSIGANARQTVAVHETAQGVGRNVAASVKVEASLPIVVERPMYFAYGGSMGTADGGHVAIGYSP